MLGLRDRHDVNWHGFLDLEGAAPMYFEFIWATSVLRKLDERDLNSDDIEAVVCHPRRTDISNSTGRPVAFGWVSDGRYVIVVYEQIDEMTIQVITAYQVQEPRR